MCSMVTVGIKQQSAYNHPVHVGFTNLFEQLHTLGHSVGFSNIPENSSTCWFYMNNIKINISCNVRRTDRLSDIHHNVVIHYSSLLRPV